MTKTEAIVYLSAILNRGASPDSKTTYFKNKKHDKLLDLLLKYLQSSSILIGNPRIYKTQALNDHGVDLILEFPNGTKIGMQIKSHFDVTEREFAMKVKAQMAESQFHGLDKWYLLICSPLKDDKTDFSSKISHLINELSSYKTTYHIIYSPQQCYNIFKKGVINEREFQLIKNQFYVEPVDWSQLLKELKLPGKTSGYLSNAEKLEDIPPSTANLYLSYLNLGSEEQESTLKHLFDLQNLLKKLSKKTREFLYTALSRAIKFDNFRQISLCPCQDLENYLGISSEKIKREVSILEGQKIAYIDYDDDNIYYVAICKAIPDYHILEDIKEFSKKFKKPLINIIVDLNFSHFDA